MAENITIARPYAKAVFDIAKNNNMLNDWDKFLFYLSVVTSNEIVIDFIKNKTVPYEIKTNLILEVLDFQNNFNKDIHSFCNNFLISLSYYGRLLYAKDIYILYKDYVNFEIGSLDVVVKVAYNLSNEQKDEIINSLSTKFNKKIVALFEIDESLLGGFLAKAGDFVLDSSIIGNLSFLRTKIMF